MRITVQAQIEGSDGQGSRSVTVGVIGRGADSAPTSGLGLFLGEAHEILQRLQAVMLQEQTAEFVDVASRCGTCSARPLRPPEPQHDVAWDAYLMRKAA